MVSAQCHTPKQTNTEAANASHDQFDGLGHRPHACILTLSFGAWLLSGILKESLVKLKSMKRRLLLFPLLALHGFLFAAATEPGVEPLPEAISNNAVAILKVKGQLELFSMMGMGPKKTWDAVSNEAYELDASSGKVYSIHAVPGTAGRVGAMAVGAANHVFSWVATCYSRAEGWRSRTWVSMRLTTTAGFDSDDMPVAVGEAVIGVYRDRYIYLVGGRIKRRPGDRCPDVRHR